MDKEEERVLYLTRVGREKIFKYGTYNMAQYRAITQDHPFYDKREDGDEDEHYFSPSHMMLTEMNEGGAQDATGDIPPAADVPAGADMPANDIPDDPEALAAQVMSSNFKVGLSQAEVDALLNGMS